jgi:heme-degrading monooxygenase HmoA
MPNVFQVVHARVRAGSEAEMLDARPAMIVALQEEVPGFVDAELVKLADGTWLDIVQWDSEEAARGSERAHELPQVAATVRHVDEVLSIFEGISAEPRKPAG